MKRKGRTWTEEQKFDAAERMRKMMAAKKEKESGVAVAERLPEGQKIRPPEVQAVIDSMDPVRRAKLQSVQARQWSRDAVTDKATREALERFDASKTTGTSEAPFSVVGEQREVPGVAVHTEPQPMGVVAVPPRPGSREVSLIVKNDGTMVSMYGPCVCGVPKRVWHVLCLRGS